MRKLLKHAALVLFLLAVALGVNAYLVATRTRAAEARQGGHLVDVGEAVLNVRVDGGEARGTPVVLIHGFSAAIDWWDRVAPELSVDHPVIRVDLLGHGGSQAPLTGYQIAHQARLVGRVLDGLKIERCILVGHSMGGEVITALAAQNPERVDRMVIIDTPPLAGYLKLPLSGRLVMTPVIGEALFRLENPVSVRESLQAAFAPGFQFPESFVGDVLQLPYAAVTGAHEDSTAFRGQKSVPDRLAPLKIPLLVIFGAEDAIASPVVAKLYEKVPGTRIEILPGVGHSAMVEKPRETLRLMQSFFSDQRAAAR